MLESSRSEERQDCFFCLYFVVGAACSSLHVTAHKPKEVCQSYNYDNVSLESTFSS